MGLRSIVSASKCDGNGNGAAARDRLAWISAVSALALLLTTNCEVIPDQPSSDATCSAEDGGVSQEDTDTEADTDVACLAEDSEATSSIAFSTANIEVASNGPDSTTAAGASQIVCYQAGQAANLALSVSTAELRFQHFCPADSGPATASARVSVSKNGGPAVDLFDASATLGCDDADVTNDGFPTCTASIPGERWFCNGFQFLPDALAVQPDDLLRAEYVYSAESLLSAAAAAGHTNQVRFEISSQLSGPNLVTVPCTTATSCVIDADCTGPNENCRDGFCRVPSFGTNLAYSWTTDPDPVDPGQPFGADLTLDVAEGDLFPWEFYWSVSTEALDAAAPLAEGQVAGACLFGSLERFVIATGTAYELFLDVDGNLVADAGDPTLTYGDGAGGRFEIVIDVPGSRGRTTIAADTTVTCALNSLFVAGTEGTYTIEFRATSIDPDTDGGDDGAGLPPIVVERNDEDLVIGSGGSAATCGDPVPLTAGASVSGASADAVTASDALFILRAAIALETCELCICDVDDSGGTSATDALATLRAAVGQSVSFTCPAC
jgi:hypothetical protein